MLGKSSNSENGTGSLDAEEVNNQDVGVAGEAVDDGSNTMLHKLFVRILI
jgi:hypothetical protein